MKGSKETKSPEVPPNSGGLPLLSVSYGAHVAPLLGTSIHSLKRAALASHSNKGNSYHAAAIYLLPDPKALWVVLSNPAPDSPGLLATLRLL